jgi:hypothetical protein
MLAAFGGHLLQRWVRPYAGVHLSSSRRPEPSAQLRSGTKSAPPVMSGGPSYHSNSRAFVSYPNFKLRTVKGMIVS